MYPSTEADFAEAVLFDSLPFDAVLAGLAIDGIDRASDEFGWDDAVAFAAEADGDDEDDESGDDESESDTEEQADSDDDQDGDEDAGKHAEESGAPEEDAA